MAAEPKDEESIFHAALAKPVGDRAAYLQAACGGDPGLLAQIQSLLSAYEVRDNFLESPPVGEGPGLDDSPVSEAPGAIIGRYKLLEKIGEGGMAVVYMAEQTEPIRRKVAFKIIKLGMDTRQVIARFEAERQALALMDHPSIAKVLDAGATETGRPYFVMELVTGVSITEYCDKNTLSTKDRLGLFLQVCHAVQHAHQKGIIHRDLKPSNVMVTHHDGKPVPKVIDFGIAKATVGANNHSPLLTEKTLFTRYAHIIGTPAYMSPEQAELSDLDIDTRTDIYSLGVLLYELLTGTTPFSEEELRKAGYVEMQRVIREQEPTKPSTKLSTLGETLADVAKHRNSTPDLLRKAIRGDLDWIVMKSLEKDRVRRYETAESLALDIQRHLEHRPVLAHAPSTGYRLHRFLRRHRLSVVAGPVLAFLMGALAITVSLWNQNRLRLEEAEIVRDRRTLSQAREQFGEREYRVALETLESILESKHVGADARLLSDEILDNIQKNLNYHTLRIEADPLDTNAYFDRARFYDYLHDRARATADMRRWSAIMRRRSLTDRWFAALSDSPRVVNLPFDYQIVFSTERPVDEIPTMSVAFGQKGRWQMKLFETPTFVGSLVALCFFSGLDIPAAYADFTFGEAVNLKSVIPQIDGNPESECIDCLSYDGLEVYIESQRAGGQGDFDLWVLKRASKKDDWGAPENLGSLVNSPQVDAAASISADGLSLYFVSTRSGGFEHIYVTTRATRNDPWGQAVKLGPEVNSGTSDGFPSISPDGLELYFASYRAGGYGDLDIYVARRATQNDPWGEAVNLGPVVNSPQCEGYPSLSPDGLLLLFTDNVSHAGRRPGGYGGMDVWTTRRTSLSAPWQTPVNLGPKINSSSTDGWAHLSPDGRTLYLNANRNGWGNYQFPILPIVDFNGDGRVDADDQAILKAHWGENYPSCDIGPFAWGDGVVDANDLAVLSEYIGKKLVDPTLLAHWAFDEKEGSIAHDSAGTNNGVVVGNPVWQPAGGKVGGVLQLDGKDDVIVASSVSDLDQGALSVVAWVKGGAPGQVVLYRPNGAKWLYLSPVDGCLATELKNPSRGSVPLVSKAVIADGQWHRIGLVWDGSNRLLYADGKEVARDVQAGMTISGGGLMIGTGTAAGTYWTGLIDDVRIYSRAVAP